VSGNSFGTIFKVTTFGESHGPALGCVIDGCPSGLSLSAEDIAKELRRRRPGVSAGSGASTARAEADEPEILSGVFEGKTLGTPIAIVVRNRDHRQADYDKLKGLYRPGHADWTWETKYGFRDHRGGGRSSGRETLCRVASGAVAKVFLGRYGVSIHAWTSSIAGIDIPDPGEPDFDYTETERNPFRVPRAALVETISKKIEELKGKGDSAGGIVSCSVRGLPPGLGEPVFDKLDALIAQAMLSLGAAKGIEFGAGFVAAYLTGSENNDAPLLPPETRPHKKTGPFFKTNKAGGVLGGISNGMPLDFKVVFKPTASISRKQETINQDGGLTELLIEGRHDICIVPRAVPVVEAMAALVIADLILRQRLTAVK
jgi:chorismate synthase